MIDVTTNLVSAAVTIPAGQQRTAFTFVLNGGDIHGSNSDGGLGSAFQRFKVAKAEIFITVSLTQMGQFVRYQFSVAKFRAHQFVSGTVSVKNIPGCDTKIMTSQASGEQPDSQLDIIRKACFYPPVNVGENSTTDGTTEVLTNKWIDNRNLNAARWNTFIGEVYTANDAPSGGYAYSVEYYYKLKLLCKDFMLTGT